MTLFVVLTQIVNGASFFYLVYFFSSIFMKRKYSMPFTVLSGVIISAVATCSLIFFRGTILQFSTILITGITVTFLFEGKILTRLIYFFISYAIQSIVENVVGTALVLITGTRTYDALKDGILFTVGMIISKTLVYVIMLIIKLQRHKDFTALLKKKHFTVLLLPVGTLITMVLNTVYHFEHPTASRLVMYLTLLACVMLSISNIIVFEFIHTLYQNTVNEGRLNAANEIIENQKAQYTSLIRHNREIMKLQHDNKNFCIGLISDLEEGNIDAAVKKLKDAHDISASEQKLFGNIIASIINAKRAEAAEQGISIGYDSVAAISVNVPSTDLAVILGNAIDNAIDAVSAIKENGNKTIDIHTAVKGDNLIIVIKNPVTENINTSDLSTNKKDPTHHGFGIISMKQIAKNYNGDVLFSCENKVFTTYIILENSENKE